MPPGKLPGSWSVYGRTQRVSRWPHDNSQSQLGSTPVEALSSHCPHTLSPSCATCKSCSAPSHAELWALAQSSTLSAALARQPRSTSTACIVLRWGILGLSYHCNILSKAQSKICSWPSNSLCIPPAYWQDASLGSKAHFPPSPLWQRFLAGVVSDCPWLKSPETGLKNVWLAVWKDSQYRNLFQFAFCRFTVVSHFSFTCQCWKYVFYTLKTEICSIPRTPGGGTPRTTVNTDFFSRWQHRTRQREEMF